MKTAVWVVAVNDYLPEVCGITFPNLSAFAEKLGAEFRVIRERRFPEFPPSYEKLQIHTLGRDYDWNILIDADLILHPDFPDPRVRTGEGSLGVYFGFDLRIAFLRVDPAMHEYAREHGNHYHGIVTNFLAAGKAVHDIWTPLDCSFETCRDWCCRPHILDEYAVSLNLARFKIPYKAFLLPQEQHLVYHINAEDRKKNGEQMFQRNLQKARELLEDWE